MPLSPGTTLGHYEIVSPLGSGGMGEVYRARDTQLGRSVAIKALPEGFATDPERLARFEREARLLASLSHPNIAGIHGLVEQGGHRYLALELIEGESLAQRLTRGPLPLDEALPVCEQIAAALEAAHNAGIVHRDLKPANVMLTAEGTAKVLDFGLAKGPVAGDSRPDVTQSPTITSPMTSPGVILGTAAYMAPEQARGRAVDRRADAWAWGCVLFESLTGRRAFAGEDISETIAAILKDTPDWQALPAETPWRVRELLARCLAKDPRERQRDLGDARLELAAARRDGPARLAPAHARRPPGVREASILALALAAGALAGQWIARVTSAPPVTTRLTLVPPDEGTAPIRGGEYALSPDGRHVAFVLADSSGGSALYVRTLDDDRWRRLDGTEGADFPFWSPDSRDLGFFSHQRLKRISLAGGEAQDLCAAPQPRGGAWSSSHEILFSADIYGPFSRIRDTGGAPVTPARGALMGHRYPVFLADGDHFVFSARSQATERFGAFLGSMRDTSVHLLVADPSAIGILPPHDLLFVRGRSLFRQPIDVGRGRLIGEPTLTEERPGQFAHVSYAPLCSVARDGSMLYATRDRRTVDATWYDRQGRALRTIPLGLSGVVSGALGPDLNRLAAWADVDGPGLLVFDLARGGGVALPQSDNSSGQVAWSSDGAWVASGTGNGPAIVVAYDASSSGRNDTLALRGHAGPLKSYLTFLHDWTADGRTLVIGQAQPLSGWDILTIPSRDTTAAAAYAAGPAFEGDARVSHDGRWLAYVSEASGRAEIYVDRFPQPHAAHRVSFTGVWRGTGPDRVVWWRADDREIEYLGADTRTVYAAPVETSPSLEIGPARPLFVAPPGTLGVEAAPDGQRFLVFQPHGPFANTLTVVQGPIARARPK